MWSAKELLDSNQISRFYFNYRITRNEACTKDSGSIGTSIIGYMIWPLTLKALLPKIQPVASPSVLFIHTRSSRMPTHSNHE